MTLVYSAAATARAAAAAATARAATASARAVAATEPKILRPRYRNGVENGKIS